MKRESITPSQRAQHESRGSQNGLFVRRGQRKRVLTIGIGDGANEIGWGIVNDVIKKKIPYGDQCDCGCGAGIGDSTVVDVFIPASVSNWGAYGLIACLSVLLKRPEILHDGKIESRVLRECIDAGGIDGVPSSRNPKWTVCRRRRMWPLSTCSGKSPGEGLSIRIISTNNGHS